MRKTILLILVLFYTIGCRDYMEEQCTAACNYFLSCSAKTQKVEITEDTKSNLMISCQQGCLMEQNYFLGCYRDNQNNCDAFGKCLIEAGYLQ